MIGPDAKTFNRSPASFRHRSLYLGACMRSFVLSLLLAASVSALHADSKVMYDFESGTDGWSGKTSIGPTGATSGKSALMLDAKGSVGWDQGLALEEQNQDWSDAAELGRRRHRAQWHLRCRRLHRVHPRLQRPGQQLVRLGQDQTARRLEQHQGAGGRQQGGHARQVLPGAQQRQGHPRPGLRRQHPQAQPRQARHPQRPGQRRPGQPRSGRHRGPGARKPCTPTSAASPW